MSRSQNPNRQAKFLANKCLHERAEASAQFARPKVSLRLKLARWKETGSLQTGIIETLADVRVGWWVQLVDATPSNLTR